MFEQTGIWDEELNETPFPAESEFLLEVFWSVRRGEALRIADVESHCRMQGIVLSPAEVGILLALDAELGAFIAEWTKPKKEAIRG